MLTSVNLTCFNQNPSLTSVTQPFFFSEILTPILKSKGYWLELGYNKKTSKKFNDRTIKCKLYKVVKKYNVSKASTFLYEFCFQKVNWFSITGGGKTVIPLLKKYNLQGFFGKRPRGWVFFSVFSVKLAKIKTPPPWDFRKFLDNNFVCA